MSNDEGRVMITADGKPAGLWRLSLIAIAMTLPFAETQWYYAIRKTPSNVGNIWFYIFLGLFTLLTFGVMLGCLAATEAHFKRYLPRLTGILESGAIFKGIFSRSHLRQTLVLSLGVILTILITEGWEPHRVFMFVEDHLRELIIAGILAFLLPAVTKMIYQLVRMFISGNLEKPLQQVVNDWSLVFLILPLYLIAFFLFTAGLTNWFRFDAGYNYDIGLYWKDYWKDLILLCIIIGLYIGTFKLVVHRATTAVFKSPRAFLIFAAACSVISVLAIHAEFAGLGIDRPATTPQARWQVELGIFHVAIRDVGFLLLPIAIYLFWMFKCVVKELACEHSKNGDEDINRSLWAE